MNQKRRRVNNFKRKKIGSKLNFKSMFFVVLILLLVGLVFLIIKFIFSGNDARTVVAIKSKDGDVIVTSLNRSTGEISSIIIPRNTQLDASRQLGTWKVDSLWKLGFDENFEGRLLQESIAKNFYFPVDSWADEEGIGLATGDLSSVIKAALVPYKTNLTFAQKIKLAIFSLGVKDNKRDTLDLSQAQVLTKKKFADGTSGYIVSGDMPTRITSIFSENFSDSNVPRVLIKDRSNEQDVAVTLGKIIEVMGGKVSSVEKESVDESDCEILGSEKDLINIFAKIYSCKVGNSTPERNFDMEVIVGTKFAKRF